MMRPWFFQLSQQARVAALLAALAIVGVFVTATQLTPDRRGYGTHQQLGLPECQFQTLTGLNCPQCGMTTSFAHVVRGQTGRAWRANPAGPVLALLLAVVVLPWCLIAGFTGRSIGTTEPGLTGIQLAGVYVVFAVACWLLRLDLLW